MLSLARALRPCSSRPFRVLQCTRSFAQAVDNATSSQVLVPTSTSIAETTTRTVDWRKERVPVREDHGLYAFFRRKELKDGEVLTGEDRYELFEPAEGGRAFLSGRGWKAAELRLKSFRDLHVLWYVLLRERNLLATQRDEVRRLSHIKTEQGQIVYSKKMLHVRKSMARLKQVLSERRVAYEKAMEIAQTERDAYHNAQILDHMEKEYKVKTRRERKEAKLAKERKKAEMAKRAKEMATTKETASETAAAGLFGPSQGSH